MLPTAVCSVRFAMRSCDPSGPVHLMLLHTGVNLPADCGVGWGNECKAPTHPATRQTAREQQMAAPRQSSASAHAAEECPRVGGLPVELGLGEVKARVLRGGEENRREARVGAKPSGKAVRMPRSGRHAGTRGRRRWGRQPRMGPHSSCRRAPAPAPPAGTARASAAASRPAASTGPPRVPGTRWSRGAPAAAWPASRAARRPLRVGQATRTCA